MTRIWTDGAESGDALFFSNAGGVSTLSVRSGVYSFDCANYSPQKNIDPALSEFYVRYGYWNQVLQNDATIFYWRNGSTTLGDIVFTNGTKKISARVNGSIVATSTGILRDSVWHLFEVHLKIADGTDGIIQIKVDGVLEIDYTGDTKPSTQTNIDNLIWARVTSWALLDDMALNDINGGADNSWCGDGKIIALKPNANGDSSQWLGSDGNSTDNYLLVDEAVSNGDTDYVVASGLNDKDLYNLEACGLTDVTINRVWGETRARGETGSGENIAIVIKTNSSEYDSSDIILAGTYGRQIGTIHTVNPQTTSAWTTTELDALQVGVKVK